MRSLNSLLLFGVLIMLALDVSAQLTKPAATAIPEADGYVSIPNAAIPPDKKRTYLAIYDATRAAKEPSQLVPALNMAGSELNAFAATAVPMRNVKFAVVFHGAAINGVLDDEHYKSKFGISNPNLMVLSEMRKQGVEIFVCGQNLVADNIDPKVISPDVTVASDALIVLMAYQNDGYALMSF
ncbi:MAG TPA: DsrE family protein [Pyrinomonadaceae bacterium]|nr:DsrE family protein [Pyrinomonadaceae bacterium]